MLHPATVGKYHTIKDFRVTSSEIEMLFLQTVMQYIKKKKTRKLLS